ncbi:PAS domain S-box protein [bacterium]|nr:PAS domain S-box protein [bacterium]
MINFFPKAIEVLTRYSRLITLFIFIITSAVSAVLFNLLITINKEADQQLLEDLMHEVEDNLEATIRTSYNTMLSLALTIDRDGVPHDFDSVAAILYEANHGIGTLELVPNGVIKYIYPMQGNEAAYNYDILADSTRNKEALIAIERKSVFFAGPLELKQGGTAIIGRMPVFKEGKFWGFSVVIISLNDFLKASHIAGIDTTRYRVQFAKIDPKTGKEAYFLPQNGKVNWADGKSMFFPEGDFKLYLQLREDSDRSYLEVLWILMGILVSSGVAFLVYFFLNSSKKQIKLMLDELQVHLSNSPLGVVEYDQALKITKWSKRCEEIFGWTEDEILKMNTTAFDIIYKDDIPKTEEIASGLTEGQVSGNISYNRNITKSGVVVDCIWYNSVLKDEKGRVTSVMSLVQDITSQRLKEKALEKSESDMSLIFNTTNDIMFLLEKDSEGYYRYTSVNQAFVNFAGLHQSEVLNKKLGEALNWNNHRQILKHVNKTEQSGHYQAFEESVEVKNMVVYLETNLHPILDETGECKQLLVVSRDITDRRKHEKELQKTYQLTKEQNERLLNFAYIVSHNLRTHTSNISGILNLFKIADSEQEKERLLSYLQLVSNTLDETMSHLNEVVSIQTNNDILVLPLNLREYIIKTIYLLREKTQQYGATIINEVPEQVVVNFNPSYLESVLLNFIANALKYSNPEVKPLIKLQLTTHNDYHILRISDNGIGIDLLKHKGSLFGLYKRFHTHTEGKGLGLFITKSQIEAMGGKIEVESVVGQGTTFSVYFKR